MVANDYYRAAFLLAIGKRREDILLANELAVLAAMRKQPNAPRLFAATWDRFARSIRRPARYGTFPDSKVHPDVAPAVGRAFGLIQ